MTDIANLKQAIASYTGDPETLDQFVNVATAELGDNWAETIYDTLTDLSPDEREKLDHAFQYYAATTAWNEIQGYLSQENGLDKATVQERIPVLEHWLAFFQEAGLQAVEQLKQKLDSLPEEPQISIASNTLETAQPKQDDTFGATESFFDEKSESTPEETEAPAAVAERADAPNVEEKPKSEAIWQFEKVRKQMELTQAIQAWLSARCIALGQREVFAYPYYGFVVDLMSQTRKEIQKLLEQETVLTEINASFPDSVKELQDYQASLSRDLEVAYQNGVSEETALISDELTGEDAKRVLGQLDTSTVPEFSGPAPDGFEVVMDDNTELDEQPIKEEYRQIENVVLSEQQNNEKNTSQTPQNGVKRKLSFSLGSKKTTGS